MGILKFTKKVEFKDMKGNVLKTFNIGDFIEYSFKSSHYWVTVMGGIYFDEAEELK